MRSVRKRRRYFPTVCSWIPSSLATDLLGSLWRVHGQPAHRESSIKSALSHWSAVLRFDGVCGFCALSCHAA
jgi:hypothetical protein